MKLRGQLALTLVPMVVLPLLLFGWLAGRYLEESQRQALRSEMSTLLEQMETNATTHLQAIRANVEALARSKLVTGYLGVEEELTRYTVLQAPMLQLFADTALVYPDYYEFRILLPDGSEDARYTVTGLGNRSDDEADSPYFRRIVQNADDYYQEIMLNPDNEQAALLASKRITVQTATRSGMGKEPLQGYLLLTVQPRFLTSQIQPLHIGQEGFAFIADAEGRILIGPSWRPLPMQFTDEEWQALRSAAQSRAFTPLSWMGNRYVLRGIALDHSLYLFTVGDENELSAGIHALYWQVAGMTLAVIFLLFPLLYMAMQRQFIRPILFLSQVSQAVGRGHFTMPPLPTGMKIGSKENELDELLAAFAHMVVDLDQLHSALRKHAAELEEKVAERTAELHSKNIALEGSLLTIAEANRKIQDSIQYARTIQQSLLPNPALWQAVLPESFVLWLPRDVVGGDIYFVDATEESILLALLDCTGHGVPGAFMTMIAVAGLRRIVREEGIRQPNQLLQALNGAIKSTLHQDSEHAQSNDGLDIGLLVVERHKQQLLYAGARIPLLLVRDGVLTVLPAERKSLGYKESRLEQSYTVHTVPIEPGLTVYLTSDGVIDQLGGAKGLPLGNRRWQALLREHCRQPLAWQKELLLDAFLNYQGDMERMDDVTVIGLRW
ncbi:SpoIIE family protein phosphatase [Candidatus Magnetaquicoccus inordinatus]|uniref:SpoIIE family protein phosphatase n=1 Tax=Candidatus Magnetaquicoccus inordinatus TaxID=2496818 RepID=UPI00102BABC9|nr:SpoIIE family protein phosphatase [Candidatus Magnetaquicoccus inordinatus]